MTVSTIDPRPALVVIDLQRGIVGAAADGVVANSAALAREFRARELPVVLVNVTGGPAGRTESARAGGGPAGGRRTRPADFAELIDELDVHPTDILVTKRRRSAFHDTGLDTHLRDLGVTQVVLAGVATGSGVESTARSASDHGYHVVLATDAMSDPDEAIHRNSVGRVFPKLGETGTSAEIIALLPAGPST